MSARRRVVVTGAGAVSPAGPGTEAFWRLCLEGRTALRPPTRFAAERYGPILVGEVPGRAGGDDLAGDFACEAAAEALRAARLGIEGRAPFAAGVVLGTCQGGMIERLAVGAPPAPYAGLSWPAHRLARRFDLTGPVAAISSACSSGLAAIAAAADAIRRGEADTMLAGGCEALSEFIVGGFAILQALTTTAVRPFDRRRDGLALGEGAGVLVLEERAAALGRAAPILAEVLGSGSAADAHHMTGPVPSGDGLRRAVLAALADARAGAEAVDFVAAHGTGTRAGDAAETAALASLLGGRARQVPVNSIKGMVGHGLGASGALGVVMTVRAMREGLIPPTAGFETADDGCVLDVVHGEPRRRPVRCALAVASGFAGHNVALLLGGPAADGAS